MRGDSRRDLYAKSLALAGLGVLAGLGALVDYWPTRAGLPSAQAATLPFPVPASPFGVPSDLTGGITIQPIRATRPARPSAPAHFTPALPVTSVPAVTDLSLSAPAFPVEELQLEALPVSELQLPEPPALPTFDTTPTLMALVQAQPLIPPVAREDDDWISLGAVTGAFRKTGGQIVKGGVKTGATIVDAVKMVGGALKKVPLPWF